MVSDSRLNPVQKPPALRQAMDLNGLSMPPQRTDHPAQMSPSLTPYAYPLLLTEGELVELLRIPEISGTSNYHNVIENLKRMHGLPCIHISKTPLYPFDAVRQWILDKVEKEQR